LFATRCKCAGFGLPWNALNGINRRISRAHRRVNRPEARMIRPPTSHGKVTNVASVIFSLGAQAEQRFLLIKLADARISGD
jgi:hypothetical protein